MKKPFAQRIAAMNAMYKLPACDIPTLPENVADRLVKFKATLLDEVHEIDEIVQLANSGASERDIDRVFLTGGSSFVPAVRRIFDRRFGADRVDSGNEFVSIANGLATIALREDVDEWTVTPEAPAR